MKYLFLILSLLGLATYGNTTRAPQQTVSPRIGLVTDAASRAGIVSAQEDGTPAPRPPR